MEPGSWQEPRREGNDAVYGQVVLADHFGNLFTNIEQTMPWPDGGLWELDVQGQRATRWCEPMATWTRAPWAAW